MPKIKISVTSLLVIPAVIFDPSGGAAATVIATVLHELGHLTAIYILKIGAKELTVTPYGLEIATRRNYRSFWEEIAVSCAGCLVNFICFFIFSSITGYIEAFANASLMLGILNALPILSLDGGEALHAFLSIFLPFSKAERISRRISFCTLIMLWCIAVYIFLFSGYNYSLFIMSVWLFGKIYCT